jgi:RNA polymerase sigma-70 factor (ECF subfamily)
LRPREAAPELLDACRRGETEAFRELFLLYRDLVYTTAFFLTRVDHVAADVTQQVFLKLLTRIGGFRGDSRFTTWLLQIVVNASRDEARRARRLVALDDDSDSTPSPEAPPDEVLSGKQERRLLWRSIDALPFRLRAPVVLRYLEDRSYEEIGEILALRRGTVASRIHRAHSILARRLAAGSRRR